MHAYIIMLFIMITLYTSWTTQLQNYMVVTQEKHNNVTRIIVKTHLMHASLGTECCCDEALLIRRNNLTLVYKGGDFQNTGIMRS